MISVTSRDKSLTHGGAKVLDGFPTTYHGYKYALFTVCYVLVRSVAFWPRRYTVITDLYVRRSRSLANLTSRFVDLDGL